ncbi:MAG TPA: Rab family GTPase [Blastocatellia bacterium]|nr:Rab family GTPase [Blastocatellia bacterium]
MVQKKICMLGASAVGKTSLVARFVHSIFSDKYHTTVGVKIDKKVVQLDGQEVTLILWDLAGEDEYQQVRMTYLRGSAGYLLVADGTRRATFEKALELQKRAESEIGKVPFALLVLNKSDLADEWELSEDEIASLEREGWSVIRTSAKTGAGVEEAFLQLAGKMMGE